MTATVGAPPPPRTFTYRPTDPQAVADGLEHLAALIRAGRCRIPLTPAVALSVRSRAEAADMRTALGEGQLWLEEERHGSLGDTWLVSRGMCGGLPVELWLGQWGVQPATVTQAAAS